MQRVLHTMCKCPFQLPGTEYCSTTVCMFSAVHVMYYFCNFSSVEICIIVKDTERLFCEL